MISVSYDRSVPGEDDHARHCFDRLVRRLTGDGYSFYRLGVQFMTEMQREGRYPELLDTLKAALDPNRILAPGRYEACVRNGH